MGWKLMPLRLSWSDGRLAFPRRSGADARSFASGKEGRGKNGRIVGRGYNQIELLKDPTAHAEILAITQAAAAVGDWRLNDCDLVVTKEPCPMCAGAAVHARLRRVVFGCEDPRGGAAGSVINLLQMSQLNHRCDIASGVLAQECSVLLQEFFRSKRDTIDK